MELVALEKKLMKVNSSVVRVRYSRGLWRVVLQYGISQVSDTMYSLGSGTSLESAVEACLGKIPELAKD